jgi:hypothetical protein
MDVNKSEMSPQLQALQTTDLSPIIRIAGVLIPRAYKAFLPALDSKQRSAFEKMMPVGGEKRIFIQLAGTPTPPIVIQLAQPLKMYTLSETEVKQQQIEGIRLTVEDLQVLTGRRIGRLIWRLKGQTGSLLNLSVMFAPLILLGPAELKDLRGKANSHFKPALDLLPKY